MDRGNAEPVRDVRVAVLMACHNRREHTLACLRALRAAEIEARQSCDVYLLDDGSSDGTVEAVANDFPRVHLLRGDGSLFWNRGMHRVFEAALGRGYDFYLGLNDDTLLQRLQAARTPDERKAILKNVPGLKVNVDPEFTIEFE